MRKAFPNDTVEVKIIPGLRYGNRQAEVVRIIKRNKEVFVGSSIRFDGRMFIVPDDRRIYTKFLLLDPALKDFSTDYKVLFEMIDWPATSQYPIARIKEVIGKKGLHETEIKAIVLGQGFEMEHPGEVIQEADNLKRTQWPIPAKELSYRRDFRKVTTFTIDPIDAKDFDDAISFEDLGGGIFEVGVHIADVSHYVREKTALDREAVKRGFSVYLVDRTIPMLPEVLSNELCSLNPDEDRLTFSAVFRIDMNGVIHDRWFGKTVIHSHKRFTYENAQEVLDAKAGTFYRELDTLNKIAYKLREEKFRKGAIDFEQDEIKFKLDANKKPIGIYVKKRGDTHKLVEEFMLLANREVAEYMFKVLKEHGGKFPFVYRIHDIPDIDRMEEFQILVKALGYELPLGKKGVAVKDLQNLLKAVEGTPEENLIKTAAVRSMAKAIYSTTNKGHFGLAFDYYTHFTSPIRRYADLLVHRLLFETLNKEPIPQDQWSLYERLCETVSQREVEASQAERASIKYKQVEYLEAKVGQTFEGTISGVTEWGLYIEEKESRAEGMIRLKDMTGDTYTLNPKTFTITGERSGKKLRLGDSVRMRLKRADVENRMIDWEIIF
jgi:ribonuclease R